MMSIPRVMGKVYLIRPEENRRIGNIKRFQSLIFFGSALSDVAHDFTYPVHVASDN